MDEKGEALKALAPVLGNSKRAKIVHDAKLFQLLAGRAENIQDATQIYSYLLRPTTAKHDFTDVVFRNFNAAVGRGGGGSGRFLALQGAGEPRASAKTEQGRG